MGFIDCHEFPEKYPRWGEIDSRKVSHIVGRILHQINMDLKEPVERRFMVGGLREALRCIAVAEGIHLGSWM